MFASEFEPIFKSFPVVLEHFLGVFACDEIPLFFPVNTFAVVNTAPKNHEGKHWFILYKDFEYLECFDCLGKNEEMTELLKPFKFITFNQQPFMTFSGKLCGEMSAYFIINRILNVNCSFKDVLEDFFCENKEENERRALTFLN